MLLMSSVVAGRMESLPPNNLFFTSINGLFCIGFRLSVSTKVNTISRYVANFHCRRMEESALVYPKFLHRLTDDLLAP